MVGSHYPCLRAVNTAGVNRAPVFTGREFTRAAQRELSRCVASSSESERVTESSSEYYHSPRNATRRIAQRSASGNDA